MGISNSICLEFGLDQSWEIEEADGVTCFLDCNAEVIEDLDAAVQGALADPIEFPSLDQAIVPGDSLTFPVDAVVPNLHELLPRILKWFVDHGSSPSNMSVVLAGGHPELAEELEQKCSEFLGQSVSVAPHDPDDPDGIAYVAANGDANPIYMNRTMVDADVVIPITCCRSTSALDYFGAYGIYPLLSDRKTRGDFYKLTRLNDPSAHAKLTQWADEAARWAGFMVEIQVLPAGKNRIGGIFAGLTGPLEKVCEAKMDAAWNTLVQQSDLTIALLDGGIVQQNWLGIARALHTANRCTNDHGAIVVCTEAKESIGKSLGRLRSPQSGNADLANKLSNDNSDDAIAAALVHQTTVDKHVYLVSKMRTDTLESLGIGAIRTEMELKHLVDQFSATTILGSAQHRHILLNA